MNFGIMTAVISPMLADGVTVNKQTLVSVIESQLAQGVGSILALGGTGENMAVHQAARKEILEITVRTVNHRVPVVAGVVELGVHDAVHAATVAKEAGVDVLLVSTPFGASTPLSGCIDFYKAVDKAAQLPILIYNFPGRTGYNATPDIVEKLLEAVPNIVGMKESSEKFDQTAEQIARFGDRISVLSGNEFLAAWEMLAGAKGAILASSNVLPSQWVEIWKSAANRDAAKVTELGNRYRRFQKLLFKSPNPGPTKYAMTLQGFDAGLPLLPVCEAPSALKEEIKAEMEKLDLI
ncbi:MAG: dihydrodipicolinate synthase family protein [Lawsonibacter sp.]